MALPALLCCVSLVVIMEEKSFNRAFDYIVPVYTLISIALVAYTVKTQADAEGILEGEIDDRKFAFKKASKMENLTWKQKLMGVFEKYERNHFKEFMIFNGAPSFIAGTMAAKAMTQFIECKPDNDNIVKMYSQGIPLVCSAWIPVGDSDETSQYVEFVDNGKKMKMKFYWKEDDKCIVMKFIDQNNYEGFQTRKLLDDNTMYHHATMTKPDGSNCWFEAYYKRVQK